MLFQANPTKYLCELLGGVCANQQGRTITCQKTEEEPTRLNNKNNQLSMALFDVEEDDNNKSQDSQPMEMIQEILNKEKKDQD